LQQRYDERVLEQRKEIEKQRKELEKLELKFFFRDYSPANMKNAMKRMNLWNLRCKCKDCKKTGRIGDGVRVDRLPRLTTTIACLAPAASL
jgi:hypothetical protein